MNNEELNEQQNAEAVGAQPTNVFTGIPGEQSELVDMESKMGVGRLEIYRRISDGRFNDLEVYTLLRFFYRFGLPIVSDYIYDKMEKDLRARYPEEPVCKRSYDDDPIPYELLEKTALNKELFSKLIYGSKQVSSEENLQIFQKYLAVEKSKSINAFFEWQDAMPWLYKMRGKRLNLSLKVDGNNTQTVYLPSKDNPDILEYAVTFSRGREAQPFDLTSGCSRILPQRLRLPGLPYLILRAEIYCDPEAMDGLNLKYGTDLVTPRGVGLSMARTNGYADEDYAHLKYNAFYATYGKSTSEMFDTLYEQSVDTVPYYLVDIPENATESEIHDLMYKYMLGLKGYADGNNIPSDGVVVQLDNTLAASDLATDEMYDAGIIALKTDFWRPDVLESEVVRIEIAQQQERANCVAIIKPVMTSSGKTISRVNCFNPDILISAGIKPGSVIQFNYKNETTVDLIY